MIFPKPPLRITKVIGLALILALLHPGSSSADVIITEFMASNNSVIDDEDGESSDWIEIYNTGPALVNLDGFHLTDDPADLTKWRVPNVTIAVEDFVIVFASAKDRDDPDSELHTNFRLSARGDYIALIDRDGTTVLSEFGPDFPEQFEDVSYGLEQTGNKTNITFLQSGADCRRVVPTGSLGLAWTAQGFDDASWPAATTGIGYENSSGYETLFGTNGDVGAQMSGINTSAYIRIPFEVADPTGLIGLTLDMKYDDGFIAYLNGVRIASSNGPQSADWNTAASGSNDDSAALLFESFDIIAHAGSLQRGSNLLAVHGLNVSTTSSDFLIVPQIRAVRISDPSVGGPGYLDSATPGSFNGSTFSGFVLDTVFSVDRGFYDDPFQVEITTSTPGATIRWTADGSDPTASRGTVYTGPIDISQTTVLRAAAFKTDLVPTNIDSQTYLFLDDVIKQSPNGQVPSGWPRSGVNGQELN
ncbi:chitobiase/beta-hexosaminidase C-terminal domain-containing protein, partial [Akkermansiaceae bacterium]|nr:chitobiase/beta-hexosaminidase C-terminal domain-containing protein [Akkermansiaceae bacterium]